MASEFEKQAQAFAEKQKENGEETAEHGKLDPGSALYYPPGEISEKAGAHCGACMMFVGEKGDNGHCTVVAGAISGTKGVCGLYVHGKHGGPEMRGMMPKSVVGYIEGGPTHCASCEYFLESENACELVSGKVQAAGCCNFWEAEGE